VDSCEEILYFSDSIKVGNFLASISIISFSRRTLTHDAIKKKSVLSQVLMCVKG
jgi:hypothetical protein